MVYNNLYGVVAIRWGKVSGIVHGDDCEWPVARPMRNWVDSRICWMGVDFSGLAVGTNLDISNDKLS